MPATNGSSTSFRSHSSAMKTSRAPAQKISCRRSETGLDGSGGGAEAGPVLIMLMIRSVSAKWLSSGSGALPPYRAAPLVPKWRIHSAT